MPAVNIFCKRLFIFNLGCIAYSFLYNSFYTDVERYSIERTMYKPIYEWGYPVASNTRGS